MINIDMAIIVEGKYDKIKLTSIVNAMIIVTNGFSIFKDKQKQLLIKTLAQNTGIIVITDSDVAGFKIRNFIKSITKNENVHHIYIPQIKGKEKRKETYSKEGTLGVEGIDNHVLEELLMFKSQSTISESGADSKNVDVRKITKSDLFADGFIGMPDSKNKRLALLSFLKLPNYLTTNGMLDIINIIITYDKYEQWVREYSEK